MRRSMSLRLAASAAALSVIVGAGAYGTYSAFTDTTDNTGNTFAAGTIDITDDDAGTSMFTLTGMLPGTTALWLNGIRRVLDREFVRVAKARGISPFALWKRHIMPNVIVSSGVLTQAEFDQQKARILSG